MQSAEHKRYAQAQREFIRQRDEIFSAVAASSEVRPWHLTLLAGFTSADKSVWRWIYRGSMACLFILMPALFLFAINLGAGVMATISAIVTGLTIGAFGARRLFPHFVRSEHGRYPCGRDFERTCISQSESAGLAGMGITVRDWQRPAVLWVPDGPNDGVSLFTSIAFAVPFCFPVGEVLMNLMVAAVRVSGV